MNSLVQIKAEVERLAASIGATERHELPTYGYSEDGARPHIEFDSRGYHFVVVERGEELSRFTTGEFDELLYRIFRLVTFSMAVDYELAHRIEMRDCRRIRFKKQLDLLSTLSKNWAEREAAEHQSILRQHPFDDFAWIRADLTRKLREAGNSPETAWRMACERYPLPPQS